MQVPETVEVTLSVDLICASASAASAPLGGVLLATACSLASPYGMLRMLKLPDSGAAGLHGQPI
jgi:hypothetical protein